MKIQQMFLAFFVFALTGCVGVVIDSSISQYQGVMSSIHLGDSQDNVLAVLEPTQQGLSLKSRKSPDQFIRDGKEIFIYYARSSRQADNLTTDDEFTPYIFENRKLIGIGWVSLGGPKTQGQATSNTYINVQQKTSVH